MGTTESKPLTAEDIKRMKETMAANRAKDQAAAYDTAFSNFAHFAVSSFNNNLTSAVKLNSNQFKFVMTLRTLDGYIEKHLRSAELDKEWLYRCSNFYIKTYPDFEIKHEMNEAGNEMTYIVTIQPEKPKLETDN